MNRRFLPFVLALGLGALGIALAPWTVSTSAMVERIDGQIQDLFGLDLDVKGRSTIAFLPVPRVKFEDFSLKTLDGAPVIEGGLLRGELRVLPLLFGRLELAEVSITYSKIRVELDAEGASPWSKPIAGLKRMVERGRFVGRSPVERLVVNQSSLTARDARTGSTSTFDDINLLLSWPSADSAFDMGGTFRWRGELVTVAIADVNPHLLMAGRTSELSARVSGPGARLVLTGTARGGTDVRVTGQSSLEIKSARDFARWSGAELPLAPMVDLFGLEGAFDARRESVSWREVRVTLGPDTLDGALVARLDKGRLALNGTLAAERLDLTPFVAPLVQAQTASGPWSGDDLSLDAQTRADLDLRVSATAARAGALRLEDLALSVQVKAGRIEASLGRSTLNRGSVRARLALLSTPQGVDLKTQGTFERVDIAGLMSDIGQGRWMSGTAQGQFNLDGLGPSPAELVSSLHGRAAMNVRAGELIGIGVPEALRRVERRPLSLDWRNGRTPFDQLGVQLAVANGVALVTEGTLSSPAVRGTIQGRLSMVDRMVAARALFEGVPAPAVAASASLPPALAFDLVGPWTDVAVVPDAKALIERSGAARSLLPEIRIHPDGHDAMRQRESAAQ
ncbi:AsmA family protein [Salinarimonas soli]|uniref:AsmA family protein n=1 Tax=Salinarimonas soli TaxID=1638099 RepID=A0A5B2VFW4_9HYPH|nr:AsmA family protein [Salinarimonas soli]KAA2237755.1 AsmA family protein [Salinarimonas soli]